MSSPQLENGYTMIANELVEAFAKLNMSGREWQVLFVILRKTYGYHKKVDRISLSQISEMTGIAGNDVSKIIKKLESNKIIGVKREGQWSNSHWLNKQWLNWQKGSGQIATYKRKNTKDIIATTSHPKLEPMYEELNDGEVTYGEEHPSKPKKYGNKSKLYSRIVLYYMGLLGKTGNVVRFFPAMKEIYDIHMKDFPSDTEEQAEREIKGRIDVAHKHYLKAGIKDWGLRKISENWNLILTWKI